MNKNNLKPITMTKNFIQLKPHRSNNKHIGFNFKNTTQTIRFNNNVVIPKRKTLSQCIANSQVFCHSRFKSRPISSSSRLKIHSTHLESLCPGYYITN
uniref:Uncharacterized protein n=1 Tax=Cannabis sativa TaxID=3483 RepID=A0A803QV56_CANSA